MAEVNPHGPGPTAPVYVERHYVFQHLDYITKWYLKPPPEGESYAVTEQDWTVEDGGIDVRHIYAWRPLSLKS